MLENLSQYFLQTLAFGSFWLFEISLKASIKFLHEKILHMFMFLSMLLSIFIISFLGKIIFFWRTNAENNNNEHPNVTKLPMMFLRYCMSHRHREVVEKNGASWSAEAESDRRPAARLFPHPAALACLFKQHVYTCNLRGSHFLFVIAQYPSTILHCCYCGTVRYMHC